MDMMTRISRKLRDEADEAEVNGHSRASSTMREAAMEIEHMGEMLRVCARLSKSERVMSIPRARLVGFAALVVAALAMLGVLALALYGAQHVLQTMVT
jgi:ferric-dicitrate binding protein FerR (iron transport regulator)